MKTDDNREQLQLDASTFGRSLLSDGWSDVLRNSLIGFMLQTVSGAEYVGSVDTSGHEKTAEYIAAQTIQLIEKLGPESFVMVCTDK